LIKGSKVLDQSNVTVLFHDSKDGTVIPAANRLNDTKLEPFKHMSLHFFAVAIRDLKLLNIDWFLGLKRNLV